MARNLSKSKFGSNVGKLLGIRNNYFIIAVDLKTYQSVKIRNSYLCIDYLGVINDTSLQSEWGIEILEVVEKMESCCLKCSIFAVWKPAINLVHYGERKFTDGVLHNTFIFWIRGSLRKYLMSDIKRCNKLESDRLNYNKKGSDWSENGIEVEKLNYTKRTMNLAVNRKSREIKTSWGTDGEVLLMCKDVPVYNITKDKILDRNLLPGAMLRQTMDYSSWMRTRYSADSNVTARRLMLRTFGTDNHAKEVLKVTRALSLSDCYWLKGSDEDVLFDDVTPYKNKEWDGSGKFSGGSISTLFVNGASDKCWIDAKTLKKYSSYKEMEVYTFCEALGFKFITKAKLDGKDILLRNFTSTDYFLESLGQSGFCGSDDLILVRGIEIFRTKAVILFVLDYLVESDDRHSGNFGFIRSTHTGEYLDMAPFYDFDWAFCGNSINLPEVVLQKYANVIRSLCNSAKKVSSNFEHGDIILKRANELLKFVG